MADGEFVAVTNIPSNFHAADLRAHFSSLVESNSFICFHFRHRPEKVSGETNVIKRNDLKRCCVVKILKTKLVQFLRYNNQHWTDVNGDLVIGECHVSQIKLKSSKVIADGPEAVEEKTILQMPEFKPPELLPQGNVGTPTPVFLDLIQRCLLPHNLISKLQLKFPKTAARRIYGNVNFDYKVSDSPENLDKVSDSPENSDKVSDSSDKISDSLKKDDGKVICPVGSKWKAKTLFKHKPSESSEKVMTGPPINKSCNHTENQEEQTDQSVVVMDETSHVSNLSDHNKEHRPKNVSTDTNLQSSTYLSLATKNIEQVYAKTKFTPDFSQNKLNEFLAVENTFIIPVSLKTRENLQKQTNKERRRLKKEEQQRIKRLKAENIEENMIAVEKRYHNDDDAEEWDRHEASEDDPSCQERNKERLYEEEIEQPWEKGGPGVVFYTDAMFWQEKEGDFDEQTTDDLDVDFSAYEEKGAGDKDIKDFLRIRQEKRFRDGYDDTDRFSVGIGKRLNKSTDRFNDRSRIGAFECFSKGVGRKVMEKHGWKEGQGLGRSMPGIVKALKGEGQGPHNKRGLGYEDIQPVVYGSRKTQNARNQPHLITSCYDDPRFTDPKEPLLQRSEPSTLKHRASHVHHFS